MGIQIGLIVGMDLVGDALIKLPALRALRVTCPEARLCWITAQGKTAFSGPLWKAAEPLIDEIFDRPLWLATAETPTPLVEAPYFDILIDTRGRWREAWRVRQSVPHGVFISPAWRYALSDRRPRLFTPRPERMVERLIQMMELAVGPLKRATKEISIDADKSDKAKQLLPEGFIYVGLVPGAGNKIKIWPREKFIEVAQEQVKRGRVPVFLLGPDESAWQAELAAAVPEAIFPLQSNVWEGRMDIANAIAVGRRLAVAVSNDCGTSHMLAAADCPLVSLFGPTAASKFAPCTRQAKVVRAQDFGGTAMELIPADVVRRAVEEVLGEG